ncbi:hypothetical protein BDF22DRAFT_512874 [Syncephalis plumigaleata]|nr:hypothetical protein BDF22DRAFT_512874 [Syncephalis plumigaleata]
MLRLTLPAIALGVCTMLLHQTQAMDIPSLLNSNNVELNQQQQRQQQQQQSAPQLQQQQQRSQPDVMNIQKLLNSISEEVQPQNDHKGQGRIYMKDGELYHELIPPRKYGLTKIEWKESSKKPFHTEKFKIGQVSLHFKCSKPDDYANELMFYRYIRRINLNFPGKFPMLDTAFLKVVDYFSADAAGGCIVFENNNTAKQVRTIYSKNITSYQKLKLITKVLSELMKIVGFLNGIGVEYNNASVLNILINEANGSITRVILTNFQNVKFFDAQRYQHDVRNNQLKKTGTQISTQEIYNHDTWYTGSMVAQMVLSNSNLPNSDAEIAMLPAEEREAYKAHMEMLRQLMEALYAAGRAGTPKLRGIINTKAFETLLTTQ